MTATTLDPGQAAVRLAVYRGFAGQGRPPSVAELTERAGLAETVVRAALADLHAAAAQRLLGQAGLTGDFWRLAWPPRPDPGDGRPGVPGPGWCGSGGRGAAVRDEGDNEDQTDRFEHR